MYFNKRDYLNVLLIDYDCISGSLQKKYLQSNYEKCD